MKSCLICDDHVMVRDALVATVRMGWPRAKITTATDFISAWEAVRTHHDLCLLDLVMPGANPLDGVRQVIERAPTVPVIVITGTEDDALMLALLQLGVSGFAPKSASTSVIDAAIRLVLAGGRYLPERLVHLAMPTGPATTRLTGTHHHYDMTGRQLTTRQLCVLTLVAEGKTNKEIGRQLGIAPSTVKTHIDQVLRLFNATSRTEAVVAAYGCGFLKK
jgi:DNA-binding NarL/FixJ family response regulator